MGIIYIVIALVAGVGLASQAAINSQLSKVVAGQPLIAALISFATGTLALFVVCLVKTNLWEGLQNLAGQPFWKFIGGPLGALVVFTTIFLAPKVGITNMLFFIIIGQLVAAMLIDHFGLIYMPVREITLWKLGGMLIVMAGLVLFFFGDKWFGLKG
ncbi:MULTISPECIES: DMT family transporter [Gallibacterium]|uniref:Membrane protein n=1 Tax=Gallibacterium genomosp. 3 TaxID=505345 RepID=A0A1A7PTK5_9PAST|nr:MULTISPECIES: DMT family transporter [Gallibacterium]MDA3978733.1 DMT family transporter [Gallibacterium sp. AGMB14963]OBW92206.1 membrane protein [Gallibacterium genomosp. 3]OBX05066.1 membrane protein [Gallibacterium genomosp. 3]OBX05106.1 membrane protein [Gallibacterium genomosp. 3]